MTSSRVLAITAAMLLLVYTVVSAQQAGWGPARTVGPFAGVAVLLGLFAVVERRSRDPLVPFGIFSSAALRRANIGAVTLFGTYISFQFLLTQYLQTLAGAGPDHRRGGDRDAGRTERAATPTGPASRTV